MIEALIISYLSSIGLTLPVFIDTYKKNYKEFTNDEVTFDIKEVLKVITIDGIPLINLLYSLYLYVNHITDSTFDNNLLKTIENDKTLKRVKK